MRLSDSKQINGFSALQTGKHPIFDVTIFEQIFGKKNHSGFLITFGPLRDFEHLGLMSADLVCK